MEIYQENIIDLLTKAKLGNPREDITGNISVPGLEEVCVNSEQAVSTQMLFIHNMLVMLPALFFNCLFYAASHQIW